MNDLGIIARQAALHCEAKKHAYRQTQDGVVISFVLHPQEVPDGLATAPLGTRYQLVVVEIGDDEKPVAKEVMPNTEPQSGIHKTAPAAGPPKPRAQLARRWDEMALAAQCGTLCGDQSFIAFLKETYPNFSCGWIGDAKELVPELVRGLCGVTSRKDINPGTNAADIWRDLVSRYRAWMREPSMVPA